MAKKAKRVSEELPIAMVLRKVRKVWLTKSLKPDKKLKLIAELFPYGEKFKFGLILIDDGRRR